MSALPQPMPSANLTPRVQRLRDRAWARDFGSCGDRAAIVNRVFESCAGEPRIIQIAEALAAVVEEMPVAIADDELVIGRRTLLGYPEHDEAIAKGSAEPGYMIADYATALNDGLSRVAGVPVVQGTGPATDPHLGRGSGALDSAHSRDSLQAFATSCRAAIRLAERHADEAEALAQTCPDPARRAELLELARICRKVPAHPAETLHEAVQSLWLTHLAIYIECENVAFSFGQMDQYLNPFYQGDLATGRLTRDQALELIECLWIKIYENVQGEIGHVQTVTVAGQTPEGTDGVNDMTWIMWEATRELMNIGPSLATRVSRDMSDDCLREVLGAVRDGRYMPQLYNDQQMVPALMSHGIPAEHARQYGLIGCHEPTICGMGYFRSASWPGYVCFQHWLELALGNGRKLDTGDLVGPETGDPATFETFEDLWAAFHAQMVAGVQSAVATANSGEIVKRELTPRPMLSALIRGCVESGQDFTEGGALYNMSGFQAYSIATCTDSLAAIRALCFDPAVPPPPLGEGRGEGSPETPSPQPSPKGRGSEDPMPLRSLISTLRNNWADHEDLRQRALRELPHYGTDDDEVDALAVRMVKELEEEIARHQNARGGPFILGLWSFWNHVYHGKTIAASADGRRHGEMMSHSMDPMMGKGLAGPTAAIRSAAKIDTSRLANGGSLLLEFQPRLLRSDDGMRAVITLIRTYFNMGGIQLQLSAVDPATLEAAQRDPDNYRHLLVRVAGYCDYFTRQDADRQAYIIAREKFGEL